MNFKIQTKLAYCLALLAVIAFCEGATIKCHQQGLSVDIFSMPQDCQLGNVQLIARKMDSKQAANITLFDVIFDKSVLDNYGDDIAEAIERNQITACELNYEENQFNLSLKLSENVRECMHIDETDVIDYFKDHDQAQFEEQFRQDLIQCSYALDPDERIDCYTYIFAENLNQIGDNGYLVTARQKRCVRREIVQYVSSSDSALFNENLCLADVLDHMKSN